MTGFDVIVCGSLHLDIVVKGPRLPQLDETVVGEAWHFVCGGKGRNQAVQAAATGARVAMIGRVGQDNFAAPLLDSLDAAGVNRSEVAQDGTAGSGMSVAIVNASGDYGAVIVSGANLATPPDGVAPALARLGGAAVLVLQNEVPEAVNLAAAQAARSNGARVILNAAPARPVGAALLGCVDVLVVNRVEAAQLSGLTVNGPNSAIQAGLALQADGRAVVVTLGGDGLVLLAPGAPAETIAAIPVDVTTTHGAGDCFAGTLAARLAQGDSLSVACHAANRAAARFVAG